MKLILTLFGILLLSSFSYAQDPLDTNHYESDIASIDIIYGTHFYLKDFNKQLNTIKKLDISKPVQTIGISLTAAYVREEKHNYGIHLSYSQIIPQKIQLNDSIAGKINGFNFSFNYYGIDITPKSTISSLMFGLGFNAGRLRIITDSYKGLKNPFFAPALFFNPRFFIGNFVIGLRADFQFDITSKNWRSVLISKKQTNISAPKFNQTALLTYFTLGWRF